MRAPLLLLLAACAAPTSAPPPTEAAAALAFVPGDLRLTARLEGDRALVLDVEGGPPGATAQVGLSAFAGAPFHCNPDPCLDLGKPLLTRERIELGPTGAASVTVAFVVPAHGYVFAQAAVPRGDGWETSQLVAARARAAERDADGDGLSDAAERRVGSDPDAADSDGDGLDDALELALRADPRRRDADGDGLEDGPEWFEHGSLPSAKDSDRDGLDDGEEVRARAHPRKPDTDGDLVGDEREVKLGLDPSDPDMDDDGVLDGRDARPQAADPPWEARDKLAVSPDADLPDPEFEPVRGLFTWCTREGEELWVGRIDPETFLMDPPDGKGTLVDRDVAPIGMLANGPEWAQGPDGPHVVYSVLQDGRPVVAHAWDEGGTWRRALLPDTLDGASPFGTALPGDPDPLVLYCHRCNRPKGIFHFRWRRLLGDDTPHPAPAGSTMGRWVDDTRALLMQVEMGGEQQIVHVDTRTGRTRQLTEGRYSHSLAFSWQAPELDGEHLMFAVVGDHRQPRTYLQVWRVLEDGRLEELKQIHPPLAFPYVVSPEPIVFEGRSYVGYLASEGAYNKSNGHSEVWLASAGPGHDVSRRLSADVLRVRKDPESLVIGGELVVYYSELLDDQRRLIHVVETGL